MNIHIINNESTFYVLVEKKKKRRIEERKRGEVKWASAYRQGRKKEKRSNISAVMFCLRYMKSILWLTRSNGVEGRIVSCFFILYGTQFFCILMAWRDTTVYRFMWFLYVCNRPNYDGNRRSIYYMLLEMSKHFFAIVIILLVSVFLFSRFFFLLVVHIKNVITLSSVEFSNKTHRRNRERFLKVHALP